MTMTAPDPASVSASVVGPVLVDVLTEAIRQRRVVEFTYNGLRRVVCPATLGVHVSTANPVLRAYQVGGESASREVPLWDLFLVFKMRDVVVSEESFDAGLPQYRADDAHMSSVTAHL